MTDDPPDFPAILEPEALPALRARFAAASYDEPTIRAALGLADVWQVDPRRSLAWARAADRRGAPLCALVRLFLLGLDVGPEELDISIGADLRAMLERSAIIERSGDRARARVAIFPVDDLIVATDAPWLMHGEDGSAGASAAKDPDRQRDLVMPLGGDSYGLARLAPEPPGAPGSGEALDLCTGSGVTALVLARRFSRVVGIDVNPRAVRFARWNARLNSLDNVELLEGDLYAAARGARFDVVTANPPFVPSSGAPRILFRDGGAGGEEVLSRIVGGLDAHLGAGGECVIVTDLVEHASRPYEAKMRDWLGAANAFDAAILRCPSVGALDYAVGHHRDAESIAAFTDQLAREGAVGMSNGYLIAARGGIAGGAPPRSEGEEAGGVRVYVAPISRLLSAGETSPGLVRELLARLRSLRTRPLESIPLTSTCAAAGVVLTSPSPFYRRFPVAGEVAGVLSFLEAGRTIADLDVALADSRSPMAPEERRELRSILEWMFVVGLLRPA